MLIGLYGQSLAFFKMNVHSPHIVHSAVCIVPGAQDDLCVVMNTCSLNVSPQKHLSVGCEVTCAVLKENGCSPTSNHTYSEGRDLICTVSALCNMLPSVPSGAG